MNETNPELNRRQNNFDLLRLLAALFVLLSHSYDLRHIRSLELMRQLTSGKYLFSSFGLIIFFAMSGFLVSKSLVESASIKEYLIKRFLRIWPAYMICNLLCVLLIGIIFTSLPITVFITDPQTLRYVFRNALLMNVTMSLPGVFNGEALNASIWTIPLETKLYLLLILFYLIGLFKRKALLIVLYIGLLLLKTFTTWQDFTNVAGFNLAGFHGLSDFFIGGSICYLYKDKIPFRFFTWIILFLVWILVWIFLPRYIHIAESPFFIYSVIYFGSHVKKIPFIKADLSYGIYLYAYPVQQVVKYTIDSGLNFFFYNMIVIIVTVLLAAFSWFVIEKKALELKRLVKKKKQNLFYKFSDYPNHETHNYI